MANYSTDPMAKLSTATLINNSDTEEEQSSTDNDEQHAPQATALKRRRSATEDELKAPEKRAKTDAPAAGPFPLRGQSTVTKLLVAQFKRATEEGTTGPLFAPELDANEFINSLTSVPPVPAVPVVADPASINLDYRSDDLFTMMRAAEVRAPLDSWIRSTRRGRRLFTRAPVVAQDYDLAYAANGGSLPLEEFGFDATTGFDFGEQEQAHGTSPDSDVNSDGGFVPDENAPEASVFSFEASTAEYPLIITAPEPPSLDAYISSGGLLGGAGAPHHYMEGFLATPLFIRREDLETFEEVPEVHEFPFNEHAQGQN